MKTQDQQLLEEAYQRIREEYDPSQFDPRLNAVDPSNKSVADYKEPKDFKQRDSETPDFTQGTGMYAIEGPNPDKPGTLGYWDVSTGEFLYDKYSAPSQGMHKSSNKEAARTMVKKLSEENKDLIETFLSKNYAWAKPDYNPFRVVQFYRK